MKPQEPVGYLVNHPGGIRGRQGVGYYYVLAGNGVFVQAENDRLTARVQVAGCGVRGLAPAESKVELHHGKIPLETLMAGLHWFSQDPDTERYFAVRWEGERYETVTPEQQGARTSLRYQPTESAVLEFHSHGRLGAFFSGTDDRDEQGFRIYGVAGKLGSGTLETVLRVGIYGHFQAVEMREIFG